MDILTPPPSNNQLFVYSLESAGMSNQAPSYVHPTLRVAFVDDHELTLKGFHQLLSEDPDLDLAAVAYTVPELIALGAGAHLVVLDLRLSDGSSPGDNVDLIRSTGAGVLILTAGEDPRLIRAAARAGVLGMVRKSEPLEVLVSAIKRAGAGGTIPSTEWAAALDAALDLPDAGLSIREREILALYAAGQTTQSVAFETNLSPNTVADYVSRIRAKYEKAGRSAHSRVDLYRRAEEDGVVPEPR
jgi:DNA-binding NarL/FixJ family response regulator